MSAPALKPKPALTPATAQSFRKFLLLVDTSLASGARGRRFSYGVSTGSGSDRVTLAISGLLQSDPVATAPGTDLIFELGDSRRFNLLKNQQATRVSCAFDPRKNH